VVLGRAYADAEMESGSDADPRMDHSGDSASGSDDLSEQAGADPAAIRLAIDVPDPAERIRGRRFLRADGPEEAADLAEVCELADVPADRVILWARRKYAAQPAPPPLRRKPGPRSKQDLLQRTEP